MRPRNIILEMGDLRITTDPYNFIIEEGTMVKSGKTAGETRWEAYGYYSTLLSSLIKLQELMLRETDKSTVAGLEMAIVSSREAITRAIQEME